VSGTLLDVDRVVEALAQREIGRMGKDSLSLEVAFEIRADFPDSKLLVGVPLNEGDDRIDVDILGLVSGKKLAVRLSNGTGDRDGCLKALADVQRLCSVEPDLNGLALAIVLGRERPEDIGGPWPAWRICGGSPDNGAEGVSYAYAWVETRRR
jgi:hypothetical protein